ncbi:myosin-1 [Chaetomidium leptoderma]|uniref:Myosin-1 n=1 Tax=Chaetomidium leptoderma TaxID=669021 RepID=A0AAN6VKK5_9PEZI|nr:myosin-1 [Chaetomidium leptoderma]
MAAREWWATVKREVRDMLVPGQAKRMAAASSENSPRLGAVRRDNEGSSRPSEVLPPVISASPGATSVEPTLVVAPTSTSTSSQPTTTSQIMLQTSTTSASQPTPTAEASENDGGEMSGAAKAGIAIGALGGILALFLVLYLVFSMRRKKLARQRQQQLDDDEKINGPFADSAAIPPTPNKAPRLSLRPVTQFLPNFSQQPHGERRSSRGIPLKLNPVSHAPANRPTGGSAWERPAASRSAMAGPNGDYNRPDTSASLHPNNPFNDNHRLPDEPVSPISSMGSFDHRVGTATPSDSIPEPVSPIFGDDDDGHNNNNSHLGVASNLTRKTSIRKDLPKPLDLTTKPPSPLYAVPPSPSGTEYSMHSIAAGQPAGPSASAAAIAAAGGPSNSAVHRVQLDFKPTLPDEIGVRAGQLVRLLHEYDDGWALCIRLDRSQQGVVPRTCLSTRPVKPRPQQGQQQQQGGNQRGGPPVNPSYHYHGGDQNSRQQQQQQQRRPSSPMGAPAPLPKDDRFGGYGYGHGSGSESGRPRSPGGPPNGRRGAASPSPSSQGYGGRGDGDGDVSPAVGQAY